MLKFKHAGIIVFCALFATRAFAAEICADDPVTALPKGSSFSNNYGWQIEATQDSTVIYNMEPRLKCKAFIFPNLIDPHHPRAIPKRSFKIDSVGRAIDEKAKPIEEVINVYVDGDPSINRIECRRATTALNAKGITIGEFYALTETPLAFDFKPVSVADCHKAIPGRSQMGEGIDDSAVVKQIHREPRGIFRAPDDKLLQTSDPY
jgi:hypothetical protein